MILGREEIHSRLENGEIFRKCTWDEQCLKEASYVLRIADDGLLIDGKFYDPFDRENRYKGDYIVIAPGKIAILSTKEELAMPSDLVGKIGIRLEFALLGLTGLMGIQVDPLYGHDKEHERLYIRVANFGNAPIRLSPGDKVFTFELHEVAGEVPREAKQDSWPRIKRTLKDLRRCQLVLCHSCGKQSLGRDPKREGLFSAFGNVRCLPSRSLNSSGCDCHPPADSRSKQSHRIFFSGYRCTDIITVGPLIWNCGNRMGWIGGWLAIPAPV